MEEQHTAHHYLEKLRKENETIALKEKDRQVLLYACLKHQLSASCSSL